MTTGTSTASTLKMVHAEKAKAKLHLEPAEGNQYNVVQEGKGVVGYVSEGWPSSLNVEVFSGKGGYCYIVNSQPGLYYFVLPGGELSAPDGSWSIQFNEVEDVPSPPSYTPAPSHPRNQQVTRQAMILGAGIGSRIRPLTDERISIAKPALPLDGEHTVIGRLVEQLAQFGFERLFVNTFYHRESVQKALRAACNACGMKLIEIPEDRATGTAGGLHTMLLEPEKYPEFDPDDPILILQGDAVCTSNFADLMQSHHQAGASLTLGCQIVPDSDVDKFGIAVTDNADNTSNPTGWVNHFLEKPSLEEAEHHRFASNGYYVLEPNTYHLLKQVYAKKLEQEKAEAKAAGKSEPAEVQEIDFANDLFPALMERSGKDGYTPIYAYNTDGFWCDIGNPLHYFETLKAIYKGCLGFTLPENRSDFISESGAIYWPATKVRADADGFQLKGRVLVAQAAN